MITIALQDLLWELALYWAVLAVSFYIAISLFWLGLMVLMIGSRRSAGTWLVASGLLLGAAFFASHTAILGKGIGQTGVGMDFWWWMSWTPAAAAPLAWYGAMLWHSGFRFDRPHAHRYPLAISAALGACVLLMLGFANPMPSYAFVAGRVFLATPTLLGIPLLILIYLAYALLCFLLPLHLLAMPEPEMPLSLREPRRRARPWLSGASLAMSAAAILLTITAALVLSENAAPGLSSRLVQRSVLLFDLGVSVLVAAAVTLLGKAVVSFEVFTGQAFPRRRFAAQWRMLILFAAGFGLLAAALRELLELDFSASFSHLVFDASETAEGMARRIDSLTAETTYYAVRELLRNAALHSAGNDPQRAVSVSLTLASIEPGILTIFVEDDGVGQKTACVSGSGGTGEGLRLHSAMLAATGGSLEISQAASGGTRAAVRVPSRINQPG